MFGQEEMAQELQTWPSVGLDLSLGAALGQLSSRQVAASFLDSKSFLPEWAVCLVVML